MNKAIENIRKRVEYVNALHAELRPLYAEFCDSPSSNGFRPDLEFWPQGTPERSFIAITKPPTNSKPYAFEFELAIEPYGEIQLHSKMTCTKEEDDPDDFGIIDKSVRLQFSPDEPVEDVAGKVLAHTMSDFHEDLGHAFAKFIYERAGIAHHPRIAFDEAAPQIR